MATFATVAIGTLVVWPLKSVAPPVSLGVVYIPGVLLIATVWGWRLGLLSAVASALAFNWFHIPPTGRLDIAADRDAVALVVFVIVAIASSSLAEFAGSMRRSDELKTALLRSVSHDLRTPLTSIIAAGAALDSPSVTAEERHELSEAVVAEGQRLSRLVENLLDVSRLESGSAQPRREEVDLEGVLEAACDSQGVNPERVRLALDPEPPIVLADPAQLERAFANLIENGVRHGGGEVLVRLARAEGRAVAEVEDHGPGIPEQEQRRIFEPFYRREGTGQGSGLGLAIAKGFLEANGGKLEVESVPGQGSTFIVSFPLEER